MLNPTPIRVLGANVAILIELECRILSPFLRRSDGPRNRRRRRRTLVVPKVRIVFGL